jgi:nicotinamidase/pyrazinamidase
MPRSFLDIDTQIDFLYPAGALYVPGAERIIPTLAMLNRFAIARGIPAVSTVCAHSENDIEFRDWPPHCVVGTVGQQKPAALLAGQRIFEKQTTDLFASPAAERLIADLDADEFVVYGVATEVCVRFAAFGLLERGKRVTVVENAVMHLDKPQAAAFWKELKERGGEIASYDFCPSEPRP